MNARPETIFATFPLNSRVQVPLNRDSFKPECRWIDGTVTGHQSTRRQHGVECKLEVAVVVEKYGEPTITTITADPSLVRLPPAAADPDIPVPSM